MSECPTEAAHPGGGFNPPEPTTKGGPDYGRFIAAVRDLQDHARAVDAPDDVITEAADLLEKASALLAPFDADEWSSPSGRRVDLPNRGNVLSVPMELDRAEDGRVGGWVRFPRFYLGRNGAAHGGAIGLLFDSVLGFTAVVLTGQRAPTHRVPAHRLPRDRADREDAAGRRRTDAASRVARSSSTRTGLTDRRHPLCSPRRTHCSSSSNRGNREPRGPGWARWRERLRQRRTTNPVYRVVVGVVGRWCWSVGIIAIPYPGPGWAIVFIGLAILATEFEWAHHLLTFARRRYDQVMDWFGGQGRWVQALGRAAHRRGGGGHPVVASGALAWAAGLVGIEWPWLKSPLGLGSVSQR